MSSNFTNQTRLRLDSLRRHLRRGLAKSDPLDFQDGAQTRALGEGQAGTCETCIDSKGRVRLSKIRNSLPPVVSSACLPQLFLLTAACPEFARTRSMRKCTDVQRSRIYRHGSGIRQREYSKAATPVWTVRFGARHHHDSTELHLEQSQRLFAPQS